VIPVVDLRVKFEMESQADTERTCIIVVQVMRGETLVVMGILVDEVSEVLDIKADQLEPPPAFGSSVETDFIMGMGKIGERIVVLLDIDRVLAGDELEAIEGAANM